MTGKTAVREDLVASVKAIMRGGEGGFNVCGQLAWACRFFAADSGRLQRAQRCDEQWRASVAKWQASRNAPAGTVPVLTHPVLVRAFPEACLSTDLRERAAPYFPAEATLLTQQ